MQYTSKFHRAAAITAGLVWGLIEFIALQRSRLWTRRQLGHARAQPR